MKLKRICENCGTFSACEQYISAEWLCLGCANYAWEALDNRDDLERMCADSYDCDTEEDT